MDLNIVWEIEPESGGTKEMLNGILLRGLDLAWQMVEAEKGAQVESGADKMAMWEYGGLVEIGMLVTNDEGICQRNRMYRGVDAPTDVLSFAVWEEELFEHERPMLGDIIISIETAERQAVDHGHSLAQEMMFLAVHALLHLLGYDHEGHEEYCVMRMWEKRMMARIREDMAEGE